MSADHRTHTTDCAACGAQVVVPMERANTRTGWRVSVQAHRTALDEHRRDECQPRAHQRAYSDVTAIASDPYEDRGIMRQDSLHIRSNVGGASVATGVGYGARSSWRNTITLTGDQTRIAAAALLAYAAGYEYEIESDEHRLCDPDSGRAVKVFGDLRALLAFVATDLPD
ncbi:MAG: hypothetical protein WAW85_16795 [Gordonia sp. (in: high G+C Gram-positive bacteria)]|uniref:hypothetical protein n=1 Tax=Gordonia sp. (in: high G+C Gram-positive bacteria) TaxID=84139 RepID=UPI003BB54E48